MISVLKRPERQTLYSYIFMDRMSFFKRFNKYFEAFKKEKPFFINTTVGEEPAELLPSCNIMPEDFKTLYQYYKASGVENFENLIRWIGNQFAGMSVSTAGPKFPKWSGDLRSGF